MTQVESELTGSNRDCRAQHIAKRVNQFRRYSSSVKKDIRQEETNNPQIPKVSKTHIVTMDYGHQPVLFEQVEVRTNQRRRRK